MKNQNNTKSTVAPTVEYRCFWETNTCRKVRRLVRESLDSKGRVNGFEVLCTETWA